MFGFHVVHRRLFDWGTGNLNHLGYEIYLNNKPFIKLKDGLNLKRSEAYRLAKEWNNA